MRECGEAEKREKGKCVVAISITNRTNVDTINKAVRVKKPDGTTITCSLKAMALAWPSVN